MLAEKRRRKWLATREPPAREGEGANFVGPIFSPSFASAVSSRLPARNKMEQGYCIFPT